MLALALAAVLAQAAPPAKDKAKEKPLAPAPTAAETAKLFFLAGDLQRAQEWVVRGLKKEPKTCGALKKLLAEYAFHANHVDELSLEDAKTFLELDRKISPTVRGKLTEKAFARYVTKPLELARARGAGDVPGALELVGRVLEVDPQNADALGLKKELEGRRNRPDAGP